jgi:hypothetical protein
MRSAWIIAGLLLVLPGASQAMDIDGGRLIQIRNTRTIVAEAALVAEAAGKGQVTRTYADEMKSEAVEELKSLAKSAIDKAPELSGLTEQAIDAAEASDVARLKAIAAALFAMEGPHGRAD